MSLAQDEKARISAIRMDLLEKHPFWGFLLAQCRIKPVESLPSIAATDCKLNIYFNPSETSTLTMRQLGFVLLHEVCHHVQASFGRRRGRNHLLWNCATDYTINRIVYAIGNGLRHSYDPIPGILLDAKFDGMPAETIYEHLLDDPDFRQNRGSGPVELELSEDGEGSGEGTGAVGAVDHGGGIDIHLPDNLTEDDLRKIGRMIRAAIAHHEASGRRGSIPGEIARHYISAKPRIHWRSVLRRHIETTLGADEHSWSRPDRRWLSAGAFVPGRTGESIGRIVVAVDTSGSMTLETLGLVIAEIRTIAGLAGEIEVISADSAVREVIKADEVSRWLAAGTAKGGGGTDHRPVFDHIHRGETPDLFVGLTDLESIFPERRPPYPVIWVCPPNHGEVPWGKVVVVTPEDAAVTPY